MTDFILPDIGEGIVECELLKWLVAEGDVIQEDQAVAEVMTDKATVEIPAMYNGVVKKLYYKEGDIAKVHAPLFAMSLEEDANASSKPGPDLHGSNDHSEHISGNSSGSSSENGSDSPSSPVQTSQTESFLLPDIGEGIVECEIVKWSIAEGDEVEEDQVVVEVMTDKAVVEIPAKYRGRISKLHYQQGDIAKVHSPLFDQTIDAASAGKSTVDKPAQQTPQPSQQSSQQQSSQQKSPLADAVSKQGENFEAPVVSERPLASPAVRRLARELNLNLNKVSGSGKKGRILKNDLMAVCKESNTSADKSLHQSQSAHARPNQHDGLGAAESSQGSPYKEPDRTEAIKGIRAAMAKQMVASVSTIPHFTVSDELVMDNLIALRARLKPEFEKQGIKLSFMPFFIKALSLAMLEFPIINSRLNADATELTYLGSHNIGMAVDSKIGLLVPNIKDVQQLSLKEVALEVNRLIDSAREGKLSNTDLSGGTISISNIGAIGGITATPVINKPDVAIVALGKTQKLPRFAQDGSVFAQHIMMVNWSGDHRVIDGATMVKFNNTWMDYLAHPEKMLVNLR
ncbi:dihydrolipoyllysine-residue acetyltransferase [Glaciecola siphonariae]|uniref:Dihydrolipoamide acetyltransferase component of pyruvate dehydrogenase complex n=1 Tax=Glaciecola siphonariae TaxID=521012 RepID=A0ABV9LRY0_9ALTE